MKVLYISMLYTPYVYGGAERTLQLLAEGIAGLGHEAVVLTTGPPDRLREERINGVRVLRVAVRNLYWHAVRSRPPSWQRAMWHLADAYNLPMKRLVAEVVEREKPDLVSFHNLSGFSTSAWHAVPKAGIATVQVLHDQYLLCPRCTMYRDDGLCGKQCLPCRLLRTGCRSRSGRIDAAVGVSRFILEHHLRRGYFASSSFHRVIHNARQAPLPETGRRRSGDGTFRFGFIGTLTRSKGVELLAETFLEASDGTWELHVAGSGSPEYERALRHRFGRGDIVFHGVRSPEEFYREIDALVVPSIWNEPLGVVTFEGMSYGVPVIASTRGGLPEIVRHGEDGLLFDPAKPGELRAAMRKMAGEPSFRASASRAAADNARYFTDTGRFVTGYENLYRELWDLKRS